MEIGSCSVEVCVIVENQRYDELAEKLHRHAIGSVEFINENITRVYLADYQLPLLDSLQVSYTHIPLKRSTGDHYHSYQQLETFLDAIQRNYSTIARKFTIGKSVSGMELWGMRITKNPGIRLVHLRHTH